MVNRLHGERENRLCCKISVVPVSLFDCSTFIVNRSAAWVYESSLAVHRGDCRCARVTKRLEATAESRDSFESPGGVANILPPTTSSDPLLQN